MNQEKERERRKLIKKGRFVPDARHEAITFLLTKAIKDRAKLP